MTKGADIMNYNWIPVSEKLPEKRGHYLITSRLNYYHGGCWDTNRDGTTQSMQVAYFDITGNWNRTHVLAWMPLPEIYREG